MGQSVTPGAEPSCDGQKELEDLDEDGIGHMRVLSPRCLMMMITFQRRRSNILLKPFIIDNYLGFCAGGIVQGILPGGNVWGKLLCWEILPRAMLSGSNCPGDTLYCLRTDSFCQKLSRILHLSIRSYVLIYITTTHIKG